MIFWGTFSKFASDSDSIVIPRAGSNEPARFLFAVRPGKAAWLCLADLPLTRSLQPCPAFTRQRF